MRLTMEELYRRLVMAESRVTSLERQLGINLGSGLISVGDGNLYQVAVMNGRVRLATATPGWRCPVAGTLTATWLNLGTASSSGSVTCRLNIGASDYDTTCAVSTTSNSASWSVSLAAGTLVIPEVTAVGSGARDLALMWQVVPV